MAKLSLKVDNKSGIDNSKVHIAFEYAAATGTVGGKAIKPISSGWYPLSDCDDIEITSIVGGRVYVCLGDTFAVTGGAMPSFIEPGSKAYDKRYDKIELTFDGTSHGVANLTSIDFWSVPMSLTTYNSSSTKQHQLHAFKTGSSYTDLKDHLVPLTDAGTAESVDNVLLMLGVVLPGNQTAGVNEAIIKRPSPVIRASDGSFVRVVGPNSYPDLGDPSGKASPPGLPFTPYGNLARYVLSLMKYDLGGKGFANIKGSFAGNGSKTGPQFAAQDYDLWASFSSTATLTPDIILTGTCGGTAVTMRIGWWDFLSPSGVYGGNPPFNLNGQIQTPANDVYGWVMGDLFAGLNIGAIGSTVAHVETVGGKSVTTDVGAMASSDWFKLLPAKGLLFDSLWPNLADNEAHWNEWARTLDSRSDAYNFAYAERFSAPQISLNPADVAELQITIEPCTGSLG